MECKEGWFNAAYLATLDDGRRCVLKVAPPPGVTVLTYEHDIMTTEVTAMRMVARPHLGAGSRGAVVGHVVPVGYPATCS